MDKKLLIEKLEFIMSAIKDNSMIITDVDFDEVEETWIIAISDIINELECEGDDVDLKNGKLPIPRVIKSVCPECGKSDKVQRVLTDNSLFCIRCDCSFGQTVL